MENKCLCITCKNQDKNGYCNKLQDKCSIECLNGIKCKGMVKCPLYEKVNGD